MNRHTKYFNGIKNPGKVIDHLGKKFGRIKNSIYGMNHLDQDWDNVIILDACRFDIFSELNHIPGNLECKISNASSSDEFFEKNLGKRCAWGSSLFFSESSHR